MGGVTLQRIERKAGDVFCSATIPCLAIAKYPSYPIMGKAVQMVRHDTEARSSSCLGLVSSHRVLSRVHRISRIQGGISRASRPSFASSLGPDFREFRTVFRSLISFPRSKSSYSVCLDPCDTPDDTP